MTSLEIFLSFFILGTYINYTIRHISTKTHRWDTPIFYLLAGIPFLPLMIYLIQINEYRKKVKLKGKQVSEEEIDRKDLEELNEILEDFSKRLKERKDKNNGK